MSLVFTIFTTIVAALVVGSVVIFIKEKNSLIKLQESGEVDYIDDDYLLFVRDVDDDSLREFSKVPIRYKKSKGSTSHYHTTITSSSNGLFVNFNDSIAAGVFDGLFLFGSKPTKRFIPRSQVFLWSTENKNEELILEMSFFDNKKSHRIYLIIEQPSPNLIEVFNNLPKRG
jgi:hypothetical protein